MPHLSEVLRRGGDLFTSIACYKELDLKVNPFEKRGG